MEALRHIEHVDNDFPKASSKEELCKTQAAEFNLLIGSKNTSGGDILALPLDLWHL
jgi:hypothetical protein